MPKTARRKAPSVKVLKANKVTKLNTSELGEIARTAINYWGWRDIESAIAPLKSLQPLEAAYVVLLIRKVIGFDDGERFIHHLAMEITRGIQ